MRRYAPTRASGANILTRLANKINLMMPQTGIRAKYQNSSSIGREKLKIFIFHMCGAGMDPVMFQIPSRIPDKRKSVLKCNDVRKNVIGSLISVQLAKTVYQMKATAMPYMLKEFDSAVGPGHW